MRILITGWLLLFSAAAFAAQEVKTLVDFETEEDLKYFYHNNWDEKAQVDTPVPLTPAKNWSEQHATSGKKALKITNVPEANNHLHKEYRKGWEVPELS